MATTTPPSATGDSPTPTRFPLRFETTEGEGVECPECGSVVPWDEWDDSGCPECGARFDADELGLDPEDDDAAASF